ncbi:ATP-binding protein [Azospirillum sp. TSO35-2]|uniref:hybrid sensor histidine kinase/response regulator n=1 Tax=Azospirillum sp. TSO35-2 TaxID=716796 RepID=UPI000D603900|nr:ATP-binding protein [Azospirillum sp. TSO35-2]PWC33192.1 histidine kinase [Azospirillum sp. TSO35-2]
MRRALWLFSGFGGRLVLPALAVALAIAALWWILLDRLQREERLLDLTAHEKTAVVARLVEEHAAATFRRVDDLLLDLIANTERNRSMRLDSRRAFEEGLVVGVRVYDAGGLMTMGAGRATFQGSITDRDEFRVAHDTAPRGLVVGIPYASSETHDLMIPVARRLEMADGTFAGIAVADIPVESFVRHYRVLGLPGDASTTLLRSDGTILARSAGTSSSPSAAGLGVVSGDLWQALRQHPIGHRRIVSPIDGVERIMAYRTAPDYPVVAIVGESVETVFGPWRDNARLYIGWAVATTVVILLFVIAFIVELQWRRHTDRALRVRNRALAWSNDGIMIADATRPGMPIVYVNPALEELLGAPTAALMDSGALTALERAASDRSALQPLRDAIVIGSDARVELGRPGDGPEPARCLELSASPVRDNDGRLVSLIAIVRDISEHKRAQQALTDARREADRANVAKSKFLAAASHDLRQPVQSLMLLMEVLSSRVSDGMSRNVLGTMDRALSALKMLLDGLLDVSRLEAGAIVPELADFPLSEVMERVAANSRSVAIQKGLLLHIVPSRAHVHSDPMLLGRILQNLVENALRYTDKGRILIGCRRRGGTLRIEVWDTGIGIPDDQQEDIFQEFVQVGNASRNRDQGLGLGLAVVRRLSVMLGHRVTVRSIPGQGSVFAVEVPLAATPTPVVGATPAAPRPVFATTVLVIEDDEIVREGLRAMLAEWGYTVLAAEGCAEALDLANRGPTPDLIVADYRLRDGRTGTEAIREVRLALGRILPGILVTGDTAPARLQEAETGNFRVMHKPVIAADLRRAVADALEPLRRERQTVA